MPTIHPTAIVDSRAELAEDVEIQAYSIIGPHVSIGRGTLIQPHCVIQGPTAIGAGCNIGPAAYIGLDPQHLAFMAQPDRPATWAEIGDRTIVRETTTVHRSTKGGRENATHVGSDVLLMCGVHIAHDCHIGDHVIMANCSLLGGHIHIGERAFIGGGATMHQFCRVGRLAIIGGNEKPTKDVPPYSAMRDGGLKAYNAVGCRRGGLSRDAIHAIRSAYQCFHTHRTMNAIVAAIRESCPMTVEVAELLEFIASSKRGIVPSLHFVNLLKMDDGE
jgi:UDP-N-acetylglucosamine acyltransferase